MPFAATWIDLEIIVPSEIKLERKGQIPYDITYMWNLKYDTVQFSSVPQLCPTLRDPMNRSTPGLSVHHQLPESTQRHVQ